jgi:hypothetical protein
LAKSRAARLVVRGCVQGDGQAARREGPLRHDEAVDQRRLRILRLRQHGDQPVNDVVALIGFGDLIVGVDEGGHRIGSTGSVEPVDIRSAGAFVGAKIGCNACTNNKLRLPRPFHRETNCSLANGANTA